VLTKDLLRVSRRGGGYRPQFAAPEDEELAARLLGIFQGYVGESREDLRAAVEAVERETDDFKLVRGLAHLLEREAAFETRAPVAPERAREAAFAAGERVGVVTDAEREEALGIAADRLDAAPDEVAVSLYADREDRQVLAGFDPRWEPLELVARYNLSLAQTALFDATELRARTDDPRALVSAVKRLGLLYEFYRVDGDQEVRLIGPDRLFRRTRRYGTRFARVLRAVARSGEWRVEATIDDRGTERELALTHDDPVSVPDAEPTEEYDSGVEREFAARFEALDLDWELVREPAVLEAGDRLMVPDFTFEYRHADFRVYFEIMGFWTPEYVEKKLAQLEAVDDAELLVAVDESLGVGEQVETRDHRAIAYSGSVRVKDVRDALRKYERELVSRAAGDLPDELTPDVDVVSLSTLADRYGVSEAALEEKSFPAHDVVGRTLVRPRVLEGLGDELAPGMSLSDAETVLEERGIGDASATLAALGYRVEWNGLAGGTLREK